MDLFGPLSSFKHNTESMARHRILLGPAGTPTGTNGGTLKGVEEVANIGLDAMEVQFTHGVRMGLNLAEEVGKASKYHKVSLSVHAPYYINLCTEDKDKLLASKRRIMDSVARAEIMGAAVVVFHPGFYGKLDNQEAFDRVFSSCKELSKKMPPGVRLGLETGGKSDSFGTLDEIVNICKKARKCVPVIDFAHIYARQVGHIDYAAVLDAVKPLRLNRLHTHFSNIEYTAKGERAHLPLDSKPPFKPLAQEILKRSLDITIISESPMLEQDSLKMKRIFSGLGYNFD